MGHDLGYEPVVHVLAALTRAAQEVQAHDRGFSLEVLRWSRAPDSTRRDGVPADAYPHADKHGDGSSPWEAGTVRRPLTEMLDERP